MTKTTTIQYAFTAGEISPRLHNRSDFEKYDLGVRKALNFFVDYRGGLTTRPGTEFVSFIPDEDQEHRFAEYTLSDNEADRVTCIFGPGYLWFYHDGGLIIERAGDVSEGVEGDYWSQNGRLIKVYDTGARYYDDKTLASGRAEKLYTLATPYNSEALAELRFRQDLNQIIITSPYYAQRSLTRKGNVDWELSEVLKSPDLSKVPEDLRLISASPADPETNVAADAAVIFSVTAVLPEGEGLSAQPRIITGIVPYNSVKGHATFGWNPVPGALYYNVYRGPINYDAANVSLSENLGYIGRAYGTTLTDTNLIPDYTKTPPKKLNPFARGGISRIEVQNGGEGYQPEFSIGIEDSTGSGAYAYPIVNDGVVTQIILLTNGSNYSDPTLTLNSSTGSGATFAIELLPLTGTFPRVSTKFQQRRIFGGSDNKPVTIQGSRINNRVDFSLSESLADSPYEFDLDSYDLAPITHLEATRGGLLVFTPTAIWLVSGGNSGSVSAANALAEVQNYVGAANIEALRVDAQLLYMETFGKSARLLNFNEFSRTYEGEDVTILSTHLFSSPVKRWAYMREPYRQILAITQEGNINALTLEVKQEVYSWTRWKTQGLYQAVSSTPSNKFDTALFIVKRFLHGRWMKTLERQKPFQPVQVEDQWAVDCGLALEPKKAEHPLAFATNEEFHTKEVLKVNDIVRAYDGKFLVKTANLTDSMNYYTVVELKENNKEQHISRRLYPTTEWFYGTPTKIVRNLEHLEGQTVSILADGNVVKPQTVVDGQITLTAKASKVVIGLGYECVIEPLPFVVPGKVVENRFRRPVSTTLNLLNARGLELQVEGQKPYPMKDRTTENYGEEIDPRTGVVKENLPSNYSYTQTFQIIQRNPLSSTVLGFAIELDVTSV